MLYFDILEDLTDDLELLTDYFHFLSINELTYELNYRPNRRAEFYLETYDTNLPPIRWHRPLEMVVVYNDLDVIKFLHKKRYEFPINSLRVACHYGLIDIVKWAHDVAGVTGDDLIDYACMGKRINVADWLHKKGHQVQYRETIERSWDSKRCSGSDVLKWLYINQHINVLNWLGSRLGGNNECLAIAKWLHVHCGYDFDDIVIDKP